jgi:hypothetical protein
VQPGAEDLIRAVATTCGGLLTVRRVLPRHHIPRAKDAVHSLSKKLLSWARIDDFMGSHILESLTGTQAENLLPFLVRKLSHDVFLCTFTFILSAATVPVLQGARGNAYYFACPSLPGTGAHGSVYSMTVSLLP